MGPRAYDTRVFVTFILLSPDVSSFNPSALQTPNARLK